jgi:Protein tyrosine and serine/threonine kinase
VCVWCCEFAWGKNRRARGEQEQHTAATAKGRGKKKLKGRGFKKSRKEGKTKGASKGKRKKRTQGKTKATETKAMRGCKEKRKAVRRTGLSKDREMARLSEARALLACLGLLCAASGAGGVLWAPLDPLSLSSPALSGGVGAQFSCGARCAAVSVSGDAVACCARNGTTAGAIVRSAPFSFAESTAASGSGPGPVFVPLGAQASQITPYGLTVATDAIFVSSYAAQVFRVCRTPESQYAPPGAWSYTGMLADKDNVNVFAANPADVTIAASRVGLFLDNHTHNWNRFHGACGAQNLPSAAAYAATSQAVYEMMDNSAIPSHSLTCRQTPQGRPFLDALTCLVLVSYDDAQTNYKSETFASHLGAGLVPPTDAFFQLNYGSNGYVSDFAATLLHVDTGGTKLTMRRVDGATSAAAADDVTCDSSVVAPIIAGWSAAQVARVFHPNEQGTKMEHVLLAYTDGATNTTTIKVWSSDPAGAGPKPCVEFRANNTGGPVFEATFPGIVYEAWLKVTPTAVPGHSVLRAFVHLVGTDGSTYVANLDRGKIYAWSFVEPSCRVGFGCSPGPNSPCPSQSDWCYPTGLTCQTLSGSDSMCAPTAQPTCVPTAANSLTFATTTSLSTANPTAVAIEMKRDLCINTGIAAQRILTHSVAAKTGNIYDFQASVAGDNTTGALEGKSTGTGLFSLCEAASTTCPCTQFESGCQAVPEPPTAVSDPAASSSSDVVLYIIIAAVLFGLLLLVGAGFVFIFTRSKDKDFDREAARRNTGGAKITNKEFEELLLAAGGDSSTFISDCQVGDKLGGGNFAAVYKGTWRDTTPVAMKELKDAEEAKAFAEEAALLRKLNHPKIVKYLGIFRDEVEDRRFIVTEFMAAGAVRDLLLSTDCNQLQLLHMATDAAAGMVYLSSAGVVHRDLALRNLLASPTSVAQSADGESLGMVYVAKVADFGLSKVIGTDDGDYYKSTDKEIPVKWTAPEALTHGKFTIKSDVWSFGILMTELFSGAGVPYPGLTNAQSVEKVRDGYRMPIMEGCPVGVYELLLRCWDEEPTERPSFQEVYGTLKGELSFHAQEVGAVGAVYDQADADSRPASMY